MATSSRRRVASWSARRARARRCLRSTATQAPGSTTSELMLSGGFILIPLAWDKAGQIASALTTGEGGYAVHYYTWDMRTQPAGVSPVKRTNFPWSTIYGTVRASHDAK